MGNIKIGDRLESTAASGIVAGANAIYDDSKGKTQSSINAAVDSAFEGKQDVITDLTTIRNGAAAGATAYQKPGSGIPKADLSSAVQSSLGKADAALQEQAQADWNESDSTKASFIKNKPATPAAQIQSDWNQTDTTAADYIKNKPEIPDVSGKADKATTLDGYGITNAYTKTEVDTALNSKADKATTLAGYGITDGYTKIEIDAALDDKADNATTLAGYGIVDAYTKTEISSALSNKANSASTLAGYNITDGYTKAEGQTFEDQINARLDAQDEAIELLDGHDVIVVADHTAVTNPDSDKIYREPEAVVAPATPSYYVDWMYCNNTWEKIAQYSFPGIDTNPTGNSSNVPTSEGTYEEIVRLGGVREETHPLASSATTTVRSMPIYNGKKYSVYLKSDQNTGCYIRFGLGSSEPDFNRSVAVSPENLIDGILVSLVSIKNGARIYTSTTNAANDDVLDDYSNVNTEATIYWSIFEEGNEAFDSEITKNSEVCEHVAPKLYIPNLFTNCIKFTGNTSFALTDPSFDIRHFGNNSKYAKSFTGLYPSLKAVIQASTTGGATIVKYDDVTSYIEIRIGGAANKINCLYNADTETVRFTVDTYNVEDHEILLWSIVGYADCLAFYVLGADTLTERYNAFRYTNGYKIEQLYYTSSLANMPVLFDFPMYQDHMYEIHLHSLETVDISISLGLGYSGEVGLWSAADLNAGKAITKKASATRHSRIWVNSITGTNKNVLLYISLKDITEPESLNREKSTDIDRIVASDSLNGNIRNLGVNPNRNRLWIGEVAQAGSFFGFEYNGYAVASIDKTEAIPFNGCTFFLHMPKYLRCDILHCVANRNTEPSLTNHSGWLSDGDSFTFPVESSWFRLGFCVVYSDTGENSYISPALITSLIMNGELYIEYNDSGSVIDNNKANESYIKGMMYKCPIIGTPGDNPSSTYRKIGELPVISHVSDIHGDITRLKNFLDYSEYLKVDAAIMSGDFVGYRAASGIDFLNRMCKRYSMPQFFCVGNHEKHGFTEAQIRSTIITPFASRNNYTIGSDVNYYYKDLADKKLRIIVLNQYDLDDIEWIYAHISSTQINWLISTLISTPAEYGVVLVTHSWEYYKIRYDEGYTTFMDEVHKGGAMDPITGAPITKIIDAFISRTTISDSYTQTIDGSGTTETISYNANFSDVPASVEFIMWCNGHEHRDHIGYISNTTNKILNCNIACGVATYDYGDNNGLASCCDMPRGGLGTTQDCINVYAIDRESKTVRVARVGANINRDMEDRKWMIIPYKDV